MSQRQRRRWPVVATVVAVMTAALVTAARLQPADGNWARIEVRDLVIGAEVEGELEAVDSAELGPPQIRELWNYKLSFLAPEGSKVGKGTPVLGFDTTELQQKLQEEMAERDSAQKELEQATTDTEKELRNLQLQLAETESELRRADLKLAVPETVAARSELDKAKIDRRLAELEAAGLQATLEHNRIAAESKLAAMRERRDRAATKVSELEANIARMTVAAPRTGTLIYKTNWQGEKKKIGDRVWRTEKVVEIPDLSRMRGQGQVDEADAGRIAVGQRVILRLEAHPDVDYRARVRNVHRAVQQRSWSDPEKVVRLEIDLDETDEERMRPGMRFRGQIVAERVAEALVVPVEAVALHPQGACVTLSTLLGKRQVFPRLGRRNKEYFEVLDGLQEGDRVLLRGSDGEATS